jgi:hypothetical protein
VPVVGCPVRPVTAFNRRGEPRVSNPPGRVMQHRGVQTDDSLGRRKEPIEKAPEVEPDETPEQDEEE